MLLLLLLLLLLVLLVLLLLLADCSKVLAAPASPFGHSRLCSPTEILIYSLSLARLGLLALHLVGQI